MNGQDSKSHFAELAVELMGSKMIADVVRDVWESASPEVKRELADKVVARLGEELAKESLYTEKAWVLREAVRLSTKAHLPALRERIDAEVKKIMSAGSVEAEVQRICNVYVKDAAKAACREAASQIR